MAPKLKMVTFNHIKHKPLEVVLLNLSKIWGSEQTCATDEEAVDENVDHITSGMLLPMAPLTIYMTK